MEKPKHKDGMLEAGKKRLEQFRQKKNKGSSSKKTKQTADTEHGRPRTEVENAFQTSSKAKSSTLIDDSDALSTKGSREHTSVPNRSFNDCSKESSTGSNMMTAGDDASPSTAEQSSASDLNNCPADVFLAEDNSLEQRKVAGEKTSALGDEEVCLKIESCNSLQPSNSPSTFEEAREQASLDSAGAPDLSINMTDLVASDVDRTYSVVSFEHGTPESNGERSVLSISLPDNAEALYDKTQNSDPKSCAAGIPSLNFDKSAVITAGKNPDSGDEMQVSPNADSIQPIPNPLPPPVLHSLQLVSEGNKRNTSQSGHDFDNVEAGILSRLPFDSANLVNVDQDASKEEEPGSSSELSAGSSCRGEPKAEPVADVHTDVLTVLYSEADSSPSSRLLSVENTRESLLEDTMASPVLNKICNSEHQHTVELDVGLVGLFPTPTVHAREFGLANDERSEGSEVTIYTIENGGELFSEANTVPPSREHNEIEKSQQTAESGIASGGVPLHSVLDSEGVFLACGDGLKVSENASKNHALENDVGSHSEGLPEGYVPDGSCHIEQVQPARSDGLPLESGFESGSDNLIDDHGLPKSQDASYQDGVPAISSDSMRDIAGDVEIVLGGPVLEEEKLVLGCDGSGELDCQTMEPLLSAEELVESVSQTLVALPVDKYGGESYFEQDGLMKIDSVDQSLEEEKSTSSNSKESGLPNVTADDISGYGTSLGKEQVAWCPVLSESSTNNSRESFSGNNLRSFRSLEVVDAVQAKELDQIMVSKTDAIAALDVEANKLISVQPLESEVHCFPVNLQEEIILSDQGALGTMDAHEAPICSLESDGTVDQGDVGTPVLVDVAAGVRGLDVFELSTTAPGHKLENQEGTGPLAKPESHKESNTALIAHEEVLGEVNSQEEIIVSDQAALGTLDAREALIIGLENDGNVDQGDISTPDLVNVAADIRGFDVSEMGTNAPGHNLEHQGETEPFAERKACLEFNTASFAHAEVSREVSLEANIGDAGISPCTLAVDNSRSKPNYSPVGDTCIGSTLKLEVPTSGVDAEYSMATVQLERDGSTLDTGNLNLESDRFSYTPEGQLKLIPGEAVNVDQADLHTSITKNSQSSLNTEDMLGAVGTSNNADHIELKGIDLGQEPSEGFKLDRILHASSMPKLEVLPEFVKSSDVLSLIASPGDPVGDAPFVMIPNQACEGNVCPRSFFGDFDTGVSEVTNVDTSITVEQKSRSIDRSALPVESAEVEQELQAKEGMESEGVAKDFPDSLSMKETELESLIALLNSQAAKSFEERNMLIEVMTHIVKGLGQLVPQGLIGNEAAESQFQLFKSLDTDTTGSINFNQVVRHYDCWMDQMQKDLEERRQMELTLVEMTKAVEERADLVCELKQLQDLLTAKQTDIERFSENMSELSQKYEETLVERAKVLEEKVNLEVDLKHMQNLYFEQKTKVSELFQMHESISAELAQVLEDKVNLEGDFKHYQNLYFEQESKADSLEALALVKDTDFETLQRLYAEEREGYLNMHTQVSALADKASFFVGSGVEIDSDNPCHTLETLIDTLHDRYEAISKEKEDLLLSVRESDTAHEIEVKTLRALVAAKEEELGHAQEKVDCLTKELSQTKEEGERKLQEAEQKALGVRERLSLAVTKGKGLVQQRDNLKHLLAEKTAELEALASSYQQELHAKTAAFNEAERKAKLNSEAGERVEALESELSYIRNSANALRESFLHKDAVLQKIEELLEDASLPEELQMKDTYEKVEWLLEASSRKTSTSEGSSEIVLTRGLDSSSILEQVSQTEEIEQLNSKCDELLRKYRGMAEQSAMLEQSLLERNMLIQRWEEMLDSIDMPATLRSKEPEDKIQWLGTEISNVHNTITELQGETHGLHTTIDTLNDSIQKLQDQNSVLSAELMAKEEELRAVALGLEDMTVNFNDLSKPTIGSSHEAEPTMASTRAFEVSDNNQGESEKQQFQNSVLSAELMAKEEELRAVALDLEDMTVKFNDLSKPTFGSSHEVEPTTASIRDFEVNENNQGESEEQQFQIENSDAYVSKIRMLLSEVLQEDEITNMFAGVSADIAFERVVKLLVANSKVWSAEATVTKQKLTEVTLAMRESEEERERVIKSLHDTVSSKTLELSKMNMQLEDFATKVAFLEDNVDRLQTEVKAKTEELAFVRDELNKSQLEFSQGEEKLASVREKLSMAVKKGKSVVQQRDTLKQSLEEKIAELDQLKKEHEAESLALTKAKQSFKHQLQQLETELASSRNYATSLEKSLQETNKVIQKLGEALDKIATSGAPRSGDLMEKMHWISQLVLDLQRKAGITEQEAKKSKKATELLALELEEVQGRMDSLTDELMHAEKNVSTLIEEKKLAEASKAEAGLRLEHAMANINSLLFELSESKEALTNLEQENFSLKDSLSAQMEEIRLKHTKAEDQLKELTDLYNKVHALKANQSVFLGNVADEFCKLTEDLRGTKNLAIRMSGKLKEQGFITLLPALSFVEEFPLKWEPEFLNKGKSTHEWKQGVTTGTLRLLCEEMEIELENFNTFFSNFVIALKQDSAAISELLSKVGDGVGSLTEKLMIAKRDADLTSSSASIILQKDQQITILEEALKKITEKLRASVEGLESFEEKPWEVLSETFISAPDGGLPLAESLQNVTVSLVENLSTSAKDLVQSYQHISIQSKKQIEELKFQLKEAKDVIDAMHQQQQLDKLNFQKCLEEKDEILRRANQELSFLHDILETKKQDEKGLVEDLQKAEAKIVELSAKVEELEKSKQELEASLGKASSRFYATVNNFNKFQSLSEKLIEEAESLHLLLEDRDAQISLLKDEVAHKDSHVSNLQNLVNDKNSDLSQVYQQIGGILNRDASVDELFEDAGKRKEVLEALATSVRAGTESLRVQLARKDALLQDIQLRHDDLARKVLVLEANVQENQRLTEEREHMMISVEAEEKGNRGKHATPSAALVTHGRGGRKVSAAAEHLALDVDAESCRLLADIDDQDKGHVFKPLTSSRLVPRGTRILVDRLDSFWVSGERLMRRRPGARLSVMLYWLVLHFWIVAILL